MSRSVTRFEQLAYLGLFLAVIQAPLELLRATSEMQVSPIALGAAKTIAIVGEFLGIVVGWLPIWLIARRRKSWARWLFVAIYVAALAFCVVNFGKSGRLFDVLNALQAVLWGLALCFLFTRDAKAWLQGLADAPPVESVVRVRATAPAPVPVTAPAPVPPPAPAPARTQTRMRVAAGRRVVVAPSELSHRGKVDAHVAEAGKSGVSSYVAAPPPFRLLWTMDLAIPPPLFLGFAPMMLIAAIPFVVVWALLNAVLQWGGMVNGLIVGTFAGLVFGALVAAYYRHKSQKLALPSWENYLPMRR